jgi:ABC-type multidrug transport system fused ATPase/permease subunit
MEKQKILTLYSGKHDEFVNEINTLKHKSRGFILGEVFTFLLFIGFLVLFTITDFGLVFIAMALISILAYVGIRYADVKNNAKIDIKESLDLVYKHEIMAINGDFSCFDNGEKYVDARHPFTFDLDCFGTDSLFNRINRTVTSGGNKRLAKFMSTVRPHSSVEALTQYHEAIIELAADDKVGWRMKFMSLGVGKDIDSDAILRAVKSVKSFIVSGFFASSFLPWIVWILTLCFVVSLILTGAGVINYVIPVMLALVNFFISIKLCHKALHEIYKIVDKLHVQLVSYVKLMQHVADTDYTSSHLANGGAVLTEAIPSFKEMESILADIERRTNNLWFFFSNAVALKDVFIVRKFVKWQNAYVEKMDIWIDTVSDVDAIVAMSTFSFNHPEANSAEILDDDKIIFEAHNLYHPFLDETAVKNDFLIKDHNYYIITGANMAGKSTFLRTLGINYILAMMGMSVFADNLKISQFNLFTSMRTTDDLTHGISYFNAELLRLRQLISSLSGPTLIILDEILKGTNSLDKLNGSRLFLEYISGKNVTGVIATHDLELSKMVEVYPDRFHNYCFEIELGTDITYSYKIAKGVAKNQNATFLLKNILKDM